MDKKYDEENKMIKLKEILMEDIDKDIKQNINEMGEISKEISQLQDKLKPLQKRYGDIVKEILPVINQLGKENVITKKYVFRILKKGFDRSTVSYKEGFTNALKKVNKSTKLVLERILRETEKLTYIKPQFSIKPVEGVGDVLKKWVNKFKMLVRKISPSLRKIKDGNKELRKMV
jgi:septal ring factor EnvC (AmiA/AmiB activator)